MMALILASALTTIKILGFYSIFNILIFLLIAINLTAISDIFSLLVIIHILRIPFENESNTIRVNK